LYVVIQHFRGGYGAIEIILSVSLCVRYCASAQKLSRCTRGKNYNAAICISYV